MINDKIQNEAGILIVNLLNYATNHELSYVYLRNYEELPKSIGNDIDLLIFYKDLNIWKKLIFEFIAQTNWTYFKTEHHSCECIFLKHKQTNDIIHIDLNTHIEYHFLQFASPKSILLRRELKNNVYTPYIFDEIYINILTRLLYQGIIREKHKKQWMGNTSLEKTNEIKNIFNQHFGLNIYDSIIKPAFSNNWETIEKNKRIIRLKLIFVCIIKHPFLTFQRLSALFLRIISRLITKEKNK